MERLNCAVEGILYATKTQKNLRFHFFAAFLVLLVSLSLNLPRSDLLLLLFCMVLVIFAELVNTAIELVVDLLSNSYNPMAKWAKDVAAGAVLVTAFGAVVVAYFTIFGALAPSLGRLIFKAKRSSPFLAFVAITLVIVATIVLKARLGRGTPLRGGMPSGHAALAFALATTITFLAESPLVFLLSFILAALVSQSRLLLRIHTPLEVTLGGILGTAVAMLLFSLFR